MIGIDVEKYIDELKGFSEEGKDLDLYSLKKELVSLSGCSGVFSDFEKSMSVIGKDALEQVNDFSLLIKMKSLASEISKKSSISDRLHSIHFNLNLLKNSSSNDNSQIRKAFSALGISSLAEELNDFKSKLNGMEKFHSQLLPKGLDNKLEMERHRKHLDNLHSIHKRQKDALISAVKLFVKMAKKHIKSQKSFKNKG